MSRREETQLLGRVGVTGRLGGTPGGRSPDEVRGQGGSAAACVCVCGDSDWSPPQCVLGGRRAQGHALRGTPEPRQREEVANPSRKGFREQTD